MKKYLIIAVLTIIYQFGFGQELSNEKLLDFYEAAISDYYSQYNINQPQKEFLILSDSLPTGLRLTYPTFTIKPVTQEAAIKIIESRKGKIGSLEKIDLRIISPDTLDINIGGWGIKVERVIRFYKGRLITKNINFTAGCGGTMGYIPNARLVFNRSSGTWEYNSYTAMLEKRRKELDAQMQR